MKDAVLWKRILNEGFTSHSDEEFPPDKVAENVAKIVRAPIIVDSRPRDEEAEEGRDWRWNSYRRLAVPFRRFWVEGHTTRGALFGGLVDFPPLERPGWSGWFGFFYTKTGFPVIYTGSMFVELDGDGNLFTPPFEQNRALASVPQVFRQMGNSQLLQMLYTSLDNVLDLMLLLGCKNVDLEPRENDPKQVQRATKRHGNNAHGYRYHVLVVRPPGAKPGTKGEEIGTMPRHVCRGHFAEYGPEFNKGLLFGKYAGRFYVPPHYRGDKGNGTVEKDYAIHGGGR